MKIEGKVVDCLPNNVYRVSCIFDFNGTKKEATVSAYSSGNIQKNKIKIIEGDEVTIEIPDGLKSMCRLISRKRKINSAPFKS